MLHPFPCLWEDEFKCFSFNQYVYQTFVNWLYKQNILIILVLVLHRSTNSYSVFLAWNSPLFFTIYVSDWSHPPINIVILLSAHQWYNSSIKRFCNSFSIFAQGTISSAYNRTHFTLLHCSHQNQKILGT